MAVPSPRGSTADCHRDPDLTHLWASWGGRATRPGPAVPQHVFPERIKKTNKRGSRAAEKQGQRSTVIPPTAVG